jgi:hypothetical protein
MRRSGLAPQSVDAVRPDLPRWEKQLRSWGVTAIPWREGGTTNFQGSGGSPLADQVPTLSSPAQGM